MSRRGAVGSSSTGCGLSPLHSAKHLEHADEHLEREVPPGAEASPGGSDAVEPVEPLLEAARVRSRVKGERAVAIHLARGAGWALVDGYDSRTGEPFGKVWGPRPA